MLPDFMPGKPIQITVYRKLAGSVSSQPPTD